MQSELRPVLARLKFGSGFGASLFREPVSGPSTNSSSTGGKCGGNW